MIDLSRRSAGILMHITSLPGRWGIGDLGPEAYAFADSVAKTGARYWQMLPLCPTGYGNSPYSGVSTFAGNDLLISRKPMWIIQLCRSGSYLFCARQQLQHFPIPDSGSVLMDSEMKTASG